MRIRPWWNLALSLVIGGCVADPGDEVTSEASSAISMAGGATWRGTSPTVLGPLNQQTCFLSGISGAFIGNPSIGGGSYQPATVRVYPNSSTGMWEVDTNSGVGSGVQATVVCINIPYTSSKVHEFSWSDNLVNLGYTGTTNTHCFLRKVWATVGLDTYLAAFTPTIQITSTSLGGGQVAFDMDQSFVNGIGGDQEFGGATAVCVDFPATGTWGYTFVGSSSDYLRDYYPSGPRVTTADTLCALTGISGDWVAGGYSNGVILDNSGTYWKETAASGRTATVACIR